MHLRAIGLNYKTAPLGLREKLYISEGDIPTLLNMLMGCSACAEFGVLSTCNRTEVYFYASDSFDEADVLSVVGEFCGIRVDEFLPNLYSLVDEEVVRHLFCVAAGLDSMVLGEAQILGQVKVALKCACREGSAGTILNTLFQRAISTGKRARSETEIGMGAFSIGSAAADLAASIFDNIQGRSILTLGAGKLSELTLMHLAPLNPGRLLVANRTCKHALEMAEKFNGEPVHFDNIPAALQFVDIVIASTGASRPIIDSRMVSQIMEQREYRPIVFVDIAVPRDVEESVSRIKGAFVHNIDDLRCMVDSCGAGREAEKRKVEQIVEQEVCKFMSWLETVDAFPVITALRDKLEKIRIREIEELKSRLPQLSSQDMETVDFITCRMINKICHDPVIRIKEFVSEGDHSTLDMIRQLFNLDHRTADRSGV